MFPSFIVTLMGVCNVIRSRLIVDLANLGVQMSENISDKKVSEIELFFMISQPILVQFEKQKKIYKGNELGKVRKLFLFAYLFAKSDFISFFMWKKTRMKKYTDFILQMCFLN